jgi:hypothetical protein
MASADTFSNTELLTLDGTSPQITGAPPVRFAQHCISYFHEWATVNSSRLQAGAIKAHQALVMVYAEAPRTETGLPALMTESRRRVYRDVLTLEEGVAICNENLATIYHLDLTIDDANAAMEFVDQHLVADQTFAVLLMDKNLVLVHQAGLAIDEWLEAPEKVRINLADDEVTPDAIAQQLDIFHGEHTQKPRALTARLMWNTSGGTIKLNPSPERQVQTSLLTHLRGWFRHAGAQVDEEIYNPGGRVDIRVQRFDRLQQSKSITTMLELKVLSPTKSQNENYEWAKSSLKQADGYRQYHTDACFACIYDARLDQSDQMPTLDAEAKVDNVRLQRFLMTAPTLPTKKTKGSANAGSNKPAVAAKVRPTKLPKASKASKAG